MVKCESKVVRLSAETLRLIDDYRYNLIGNTYNNSICKYIKELSYDKLIKYVFEDTLYRCTKS